MFSSYRDLPRASRSRSRARCTRLRFGLTRVTRCQFFREDTMRILTKAAKALGLLVALFTVFTLTEGSARADEGFIAGFTNGCFGAGCAPGASATVPGLPST